MQGPFDYTQAEYTRMQQQQGQMRTQQSQPGKSKGSGYERSGAMRANTAALILWVLLWLLDGVATITPVALFSTRFDLLGVGLGVGAFLHIAISSIQHHLWRIRDRWVYPMFLLVSVYNVGTSTIALLFLGYMLGVDVWRLWVYIICTVIAEIIALASEPMMVRHIRIHQKLKRGG